MDRLVEDLVGVAGNVWKSLGCGGSGWLMGPIEQVGSRRCSRFLACYGRSEGAATAGAGRVGVRERERGIGGKCLLRHSLP